MDTPILYTPTPVIPRHYRCDINFTTSLCYRWVHTEEGVWDIWRNSHSRHSHVGPLQERNDGRGCNTKLLYIHTGSHFWGFCTIQGIQSHWQPGSDTWISVVLFTLDNGKYQRKQSQSQGRGHVLGFAQICIEIKLKLTQNGRCVESPPSESATGIDEAKLVFNKNMRVLDADV